MVGGGGGRRQSSAKIHPSFSPIPLSGFCLLSRRDATRHLSPDLNVEGCGEAASISHGVFAWGLSVRVENFCWRKANINDYISTQRRRRKKNVCKSIRLLA